jgi:hypothetical protein
VRQWRAWAFLVPWVGYGVLEVLDDRLVDAVGAHRAGGLMIAAGSALGVAWYRLHPRPLAARSRLLAMLVVAAALLLLVGGTIEVHVDRTGRDAWIGIAAGLALAEASVARESWSRQRRTALTTRRTLRSLR